jgi:hypothetical protein
MHILDITLRTGGALMLVLAGASFLWCSRRQLQPMYGSRFYRHERNALDAIFEGSIARVV